MERLFWSKSSSGLCWQFFSLRCLSSMFRRRDALSPLALFVIPCARLLANKLDKASSYLLSAISPIINSRNSPTLFIFLSIIVFSSEATSLIANRNPSLYDSSIFNFLIPYVLAHLSQYFSTIIAPSVLYLTNLVAGFPHPIQNLEFFSGLM